MKKAKLRAEVIILDLDGTIVDSKEAYKEALITALAAVGQHVTNPQIVTEIPKRLEQGRSLTGIVPEDKRQEFLRSYLEAYYNSTSSKSRLVPNIHQTLQKLSGKARLALITMRHIPNNRMMDELRRLGIAEYFHDVITALDTASPKPSPDALIKCARKLGVKTRDLLVVGDSVSDIRAGKNAGARTVGVLTGIFTYEELRKENPDLILKSIEELPCFLE